MHELSIAISLVEGAQEEAAKHGAASVSAVHLRLGPLSGVVKEALLFSYDLAAEGTPLQGSKLIIEETAVMVFCAACQGRRPIRSLQSICCAICNAPATEVVQGRELEVVALEIRQ
ncbi:MAG TPA: hydrogenase maturation nickel metallochaperone HypA [Candidatus Acidoferrales bacterium]|jgi:hydrogenase nickel incorporation protein HypA/HybF|nr:hydrogenase maturation nickel metallochaperone HypA [Candidatus Acidoferrales bacterium]